MISKLSTFLALRYLKPKRTAVSVISMISILGPLLGVGVLIVTISIMTGFERELQKVILGFEPHITVINQEFDSQYAEHDWVKICQDLKKIPEVLDASVFVEGDIFMEVMGNDGLMRRNAMFMKSFPTYEKDYQFEKLKTYMSSLNSGESPQLQQNEIVISKQIAKSMRVGIDDKITILSSKNANEVIEAIRAHEDEDKKVKSDEVIQMLEELITPKEMTITGLFEQPRYQRYVFLPLHIGQELYSLGGDVHGYAIFLKNPYKALENKEKIKNALPPNLNAIVFSWVEKHQREFSAIRNERAMMYLVLFIILLVAAFCIMNTLITVTIQKKNRNWHF